MFPLQSRCIRTSAICRSDSLGLASLGLLLSLRTGVGINDSTAKEAGTVVHNGGHAVPSDDADTENTSDATEDKGNNSAGSKPAKQKGQRHASRMWKGVEGGYEPSRESRRGDVLAGEIEVVLCVAGSVALGGHTGGFAGLEMVVGDRERLL